MARNATPPDYKALRNLAGGGRPGRPTKFSREVFAARSRERSRRAGLARDGALAAIRALHPEDWQSLYEQAVAAVNAERGPLPGDES